ncbi:hypothetical protein, partial [Bacillus licheniformis]|uniref:hypothetical protein n=1 Tax=Bacillus licheniformis TaxID=1402 RepID=UPI00119FA529
MAEIDFERVTAVAAEIERDFDRLGGGESEIDGEVWEKYEEMEKGKLDVVRGYYVAKGLEKIVEGGRRIKGEVWG